MPNILIAGGGSGGHVAPAIAVAEALLSLDCTPIIAHSEREVDLVMASETTFTCMTLPAKPLSLNPKKFLSFCSGFKQTETTVKQTILSDEIDCVLSTGGFVAAPALRAARKQKCPTVLLNLDNPPGKANRLAVRWADCTLSTIEGAFQHYTKVAPPLRECVIAPTDKSECHETFNLNPHLMTLLVTGASQGASSINEFIPSLAKQQPAFFQGWQVLHITGANHESNIRELWKEIKVPCTVVGFVEEMGLAWGAADFAITRGGANTVAELAINAVPAIVMPYPYHKDNHQSTNAMPLAKLGGVLIEKDCVQIGLNLAHAGSTLCLLLKNHHQRFAMQQALAADLPENGATSIANACINAVKQF
jgi:UDP-N-acetylglucosamine--N-acetylmuramyl-(pentapeptide) pyrophosphoryl-undecaprenol N-acetylglucosamine transferase